MIRAILGGIFYLFYPGVSARAKASFYQALEGLHSSGSSALVTFQTIGATGGSRRLRRAARQILARVSKGSGLARAMAGHPFLFSRFEVGLVEVGENSGRLDRVYGSLGRLFEWRATMANEVVLIAMKPLITLLFVLLLWPLLLFILPGDLLDMGLRTAERADNVIVNPLRDFLGWANGCVGKAWLVLAGVHALDPVTRAVDSFLGDIPFRASLYLRGTIVPIAVMTALFLGAAVVLAHARKLPLVGHALDIARLFLPLWSGIERKIALAGFSYAFATAFSAGTEIMKCLSLARSAVGNRLLAWRLASVVRRFLAGEVPAQRLSLGGVFPPVFAEMMETGLRTGEMDVYLEKVTNRLTREVEADIKKLMLVITPVTYVIIALPFLGLLIVTFLGLFGSARGILDALRDFSG